MLRLARFLAFSFRPLPDAAFIELVGLMYTALVPVIVIGFTVVFLGTLIAFRKSDGVILFVAFGGVAVTVVRVFIIVGYRKRLRLSALVAAEAKIWERRYAIGSFTFSLFVGALNARALMSDDPLVAMLITGLIFAYSSGLIARIAVRPAICFGSVAIAAIPTIAGFCSHLGAGSGVAVRAAYAGQAILLTGYGLASIETIAHAYQTTVEQLIAKADLAAAAMRDVLTGLANRRLLQTRFHENSLRIGRRDELLAFHCLDLDGFKAVNDTFGHPTGDGLLQAVSGRLLRALYAGDTVARLGGDEFVVLQVGIRHAAEARVVADRILRVLRAPYRLSGQDLHIGASIGIAIFPQDGRDLEQLISHADAALYEAKRAGGGCCVVWRDASSPAASPAAV